MIFSIKILKRDTYDIHVYLILQMLCFFVAVEKKFYEILNNVKVYDVIKP